MRADGPEGPSARSFQTSVGLVIISQVGSRAEMITLTRDGGNSTTLHRHAQRFLLRV